MSDAKTNLLKPRANPSIDPGIADNSRKIIVPKNTTAHLSEITNEEASLAYDTDLHELVINDGSGFSPIGGGSTPTGIPNTISFFDNSGNLSSDANFTFTDSSKSVWFGETSTGGAITAVSNGSLAFGESDGAGSSISTDQIGSLVHGYAVSAGEIEAGVSAQGSHAFGFATTSGHIYAANAGTLSFGHSEGAGSLISPTAEGSASFGFAINAGVIQSTLDGALAHGRVDGPSSAIVALGYGSEASGLAQNGGVVQTLDHAAKAFGYSEGASASINAGTAGSFSFGTTINAGIIQTSASGAIAHGTVSSGGIGASAAGSNAFGNVNNAGSIGASGAGSLAFGECQAGSIQTNSRGSVAHGRVTSTGNITSSGDGAVAFGKVTTGAISAAGNGSLALGSPTTGSISANGAGAIASGSGANTVAAGAGSLAMSGGSSGTVTAIGGSLAMGIANGANVIAASQTGTHAQGRAFTASIVANGPGAFAHGQATEQNLEADGASSMVMGDSNMSTANVSATFGQSHVNNSFGSLMIGRYANTTSETPTSWVASETVFVVGNGTALGSPATAYAIRKNGHQEVAGTAPALAPDVALGGGTATNLLNSTDVAGKMRLTSVTGASGVAVVVTFANPYLTAPVVVISNANGGNILFNTTAESTTGFSIASTSPLANSTNYDISYMVMGVKV